MFCFGMKPNTDGSCHLQEEDTGLTLWMLFQNVRHFSYSRISDGVYGEVGVIQGCLLRAPAYLLMAMAMMTGSQPEYNTSLVAGLLRASTTQTGSRATKKAHTRG